MGRRMTLKGQISLCLAAFFLALAGQIFLSFYQSGTVLRELDDQMGNFNAISRFQNGVERSLSAMEDYRWEYGDAKALTEELHSAFSVTNAWLWRIESDLGTVSEEQYLLYNAVSTTYDSYTALVDQLEEAVAAGQDTKAAQLYYNKIVPCGGYLRQYTQQLLNTAITDAQGSYTTVSALSDRVKWAQTVVVALCLALGCVMAFSVLTLLTPVQQMIGASREVTRGEFDSPDLPAPRQPEMAQLTEAFNHMKHSMAEQVTTLREKNEMERELHRQKTEALELQNRMERSRLQQLREVWAKIQTRKAIYDAMQTMEYQINSNRVSNGQTPFVTVGFGLGTDWFAREIQRAIFLNRIRGLGSEHHTAIFPKLVFTIKHGVNADPGDPNYDLKQLALECATKRMYPDVIFYENIVKITGSFKAPMGCRSFLQGWIDPATGKDVEDGRMNLGVVTVNVPRIALESHGDKDRFWKIFDERMAVAHQALQFRIMRCKQAAPVNAPTLFRFGAFGRLGANDSVDQLFRNERATVSLGYIGLYEATSVFYGKNWMRDHGWDPQGKEFALSIVKRMNELCKEWSDAEGYHYSVYSTPAESLTDRFNRMDHEKFGEVEGVTDHDFYTNSFHYPVWLQPTPMEKLNYEKDFPYYASGGFINYCEFPCLQSNPKALEAVWDYAYNIGIGYLGTNTPIDRCYDCGFQGDFEPTEEGFKCPECGNSDPDHCNVTKRTCGYLGNPVQRPMVHGRHEEIAHRVKHMSGETGHVTLSDGSEREWFEEAK